MAIARIVHHYDDETCTDLSFEVDASYPDACAEAVARVLDLWRVTCAASDEDAEG